MEMKQFELEQAVKYCRDNNCKGYKAIADLGLLYIKDARTINWHLQGMVITGDKESYQKIPSDQEEKLLLKYLLNSNSMPRVN